MAAGSPGALGYGHIHIGRITLSLTGVAIIFLLVLAIRGAPTLKLTSSRSFSSHRSKLVLIGVLAEEHGPSRGARDDCRRSHGTSDLGAMGEASGRAPTELTTDTRTTTSVTISWSMPSSGPLPARYVIMQNGKAIGSVPGTAISYRATELAPATQYTYQVSRSEVLTVPLSHPPWRRTPVRRSYGRPF